MSDRMEWVEARENVVRTVTRNWSLYSAKSGEFLGVVKWYAQWRRYVFVPHVCSLFDCNCLWDIADFCARHTSYRQEERKKKA